MTTEYILQQLADKTAELRKAQKANAAHRGDPKKDAIKQAYLDEVQRRQQDLDQALRQLPQAAPSLFPAGWYEAKMLGRL